ncbi:MFS general substrate transporter [Xylona heveae TC161]|uniref:MFS general substrate transporter n=1 Tax=Xylona heveae (strain CBS 132557 / TC161) TaxID=1328760 RepID=A0A164ZKM4_XYLHT|nr:MFS general substrate transporter [Xylona heveae TC161]KZF19209.1 MFS general substrate transporter [Xylona heveae TC161]
MSAEFKEEVPTDPLANTTSSDVESASPSPSTSKPADEIPNGGLRAWLQVLGSFSLFLNTWGVINSFGAFQSYYEDELLRHVSSSDISWIGSLQACLLLIIGVATGPLFDAGYFYVLLSVGSFLVVFGMFMTSLCTEYWQLMLAQGLTCGLGSGCLFIPSVAIVSTYFTTKKSFATGIAASGSGLGGVIYPIVFARLQPRIGFGWATRVIAFLMLGMLLGCLAVMRVRVLPPQKRRLLEPRAFLELPFTMFTVAEFFGFMGLYIPFFYCTAYAAKNTGMSHNLSFYMLPIINAGSVFGRIIPNFLADKTGPLNMLIPCSLISALLAFCWIAIESTGGFIIFSLLYGFFSGTFVSLPPTTVVSLSPSLQMVGTRMGMSFCFAGLGLLIGTPVAGAILQSSGWLGTQLFCACSVTVAVACCLVARFSKAPALMAKA